MGAHFCWAGKTTLAVTVKRRKFWWTNNPIKWNACVLGDDCSELVVTQTAPPVNEDTVEDHHNLWKLQRTKKGYSFFTQYNPLRCKQSVRVCVCVCEKAALSTLFSTMLSNFSGLILMLCSLLPSSWGRAVHPSQLGSSLSQKVPLSGGRHKRAVQASSASCSFGLTSQKYSPGLICVSLRWSI